MRIALSLIGIALCLFLIQSSGRFGLSRMFARYALIANSVPAADSAVRYAPADPDAHRTRAAVLSRLQTPAEAVKSLETACSLRYRDDYLWIELGNTREELGDTAGALAALDEAVRWAPHYAHTHWQRGNLLLRMGRTGEAFADLRTAAAANVSYVPNLIDLAWGISRGDIKTTEALLQIKDDSARLALIRFLARKGHGREVLDQIQSLSALSADNQKELVHLLFAAKSFDEAFTLWSNDAKMRVPSLFNGGFEEPLVLNQADFGGWIVSGDKRSKFTQDVSEKLAGMKSLQITFDGNWEAGTSLLSQTVRVEPAKTYPLNFAVMTKDLLTGGAPVITVSDASTNQVLGKSPDLPTATTSWTTMSFAFTTLPTSRAAVIRLQRNNCNTSPCPIFGRLWLDEFSIGQTKPTAKQ